MKPSVKAASCTNVEFSSWTVTSFPMILMYSSGFRSSISSCAFAELCRIPQESDADNGLCCGTGLEDLVYVFGSVYSS